MAKERFNVGDKVVPKDPDFWLVQGNRIFIVVGVSSPYVNVRRRVNGELNGTCIPIEMKHLYEKDEQLLFDFMKD